MNEGLHPIKVQRLAQADHGPKTQHLFFFGLRQKTRDQGYRDLAKMTDPLQDFFSIHERHRGIEKDEIVMARLDLLKAVLTVHRAINLIAFMLQGFAELLADHFFVINDQKFYDGATLG